MKRCRLYYVLYNHSYYYRRQTHTTLLHNINNRWPSKCFVIPGVLLQIQ